MTPNIDSPKYQGQRKLMASKLKSLGINNKNVLNRNHKFTEQSVHSSRD